MQLKKIQIKNSLDKKIHNKNQKMNLKMKKNLNKKKFHLKLKMNL